MHRLSALFHDCAPRRHYEIFPEPNFRVFDIFVRTFYLKTTKAWFNPRIERLEFSLLNPLPTVTIQQPLLLSGSTEEFLPFYDLLMVSHLGKKIYGSRLFSQSFACDHKVRKKRNWPKRAPIILFHVLSKAILPNVFSSRVSPELLFPKYLGFHGIIFLFLEKSCNHSAFSKKFSYSWVAQYSWPCIIKSAVHKLRKQYFANFCPSP